MYGYEVTITNRLLIVLSTLLTIFTIGIFLFLYPLFQFIYGWYQLILNIGLFVLFILMFVLLKRSKHGEVVMIINEKGFFDSISNDAEPDKMVVWKNVRDITLQKQGEESIIIVQLIDPRRLFKTKSTYIKDGCIHIKLPKHIGVQPKELLRVMHNYKAYYELYIEDEKKKKAEKKKKHKQKTKQ